VILLILQKRLKILYSRQEQGVKNGKNGYKKLSSPQNLLLYADFHPARGIFNEQLNAPAFFIKLSP